MSAFARNIGLYLQAGKIVVDNKINMKNVSEIEIWNDLKRELKQRYPMLTNADLHWRNSSQK